MSGAAPDRRRVRVVVRVEVDPDDQAQPEPASDISDYAFEEIGGWPWRRKKRREVRGL